MVEQNRFYLFHFAYVRAGGVVVCVCVCARACVCMCVCSSNGVCTDKNLGFAERKNAATKRSRRIANAFRANADVQNNIETGNCFRRCKIVVANHLSRQRLEITTEINML